MLGEKKKPIILKNECGFYTGKQPLRNLIRDILLGSGLEYTRLGYGYFLARKEGVLGVKTK